MPCKLLLDDGAEQAVVISRAVERASAALCARWKPTLVLLLAAGAKRRSELDRCLPDGVSPKVLTDQLRGLEVDGIVARVDHRALRRAGQRHVTYALTAAGEELSDVVRLLAQWGARHATADAGVRGRNMPADAPAPRRLVVAADGCGTNPNRPPTAGS